MNGAEKPHYHDHHSVKTEIISGNARLHLGGKIINLKLNETVVIPAGTQHWAENLGPGYAILSAEFFPPFDGKDRRFAQ
jgi:mannose-6-phosphate isomerase-like protein (cupin superfamily)